jgi:hypothetical protein
LKGVELTIVFYFLEAMKNSKNKQLASLLADSRYDGDLHERYEYSLPWPILYSVNKLGKRVNIISSPEFNLCGKMWQLNIHPWGVDGNSEYISVHLVNLEETEVFAHYSILVINKCGNENIVWNDPEPIICFSPLSSGDNAWGNEELVLFSEIASSTEYTADGQITFGIDVAVFGRSGMQTHSIVKAIENSVETNDLIRMADDDISDVVQRLPQGKNLITQKKQEDGIVNSRSGAHIAKSGSYK